MRDCITYCIVISCTVLASFAMTSQIERMEKELVELKKQARLIEFAQILENIISNDYEKYLENMIFEEEYGCWIRDGDDINIKYPKKIYKHVDEKITEFYKVKYFVLDKEVNSIPKKEDVINLHRFPNQICKINIYEENRDQHVAVYRYTFSSKIWKPPHYVENNLQNIHHILYYLVKKIK